MSYKETTDVDKEKIKSLVSRLNLYRNEYYNNNKSIVSDKEYDRLFDLLKSLEEKTGFVMSNSPTVSVGYEVKSKLKKVHHNHKMLSLDKTKSVVDLVKFLGNHKGIMMLKMDGLTISLRYLNGQLVSAETRGNSEIGEDVLHNAKVFTNIPLKIDYKDELVVDGEAIITYSDFDKINSKLPEDDKYKNPRNLASGSVRQLDSKIAKNRNIKFIAWKVVKGFYGNDFHDKLICLYDLGFEIVPCVTIKSLKENDFKEAIDNLKEEAEILNYPIDGMVLGFNDIAYGDMLGETNHHLRSQIAYKFYDEEAETTLINIDWSLGKTGQITPTAVFEPVELSGSTITRASLHNVSIMKSLELSYGDTVTIYKANDVIPQVSDNIDRSLSDICIPPTKCPVCGGETKIKKDNDVEVLVCTNPNCKGKLLSKLTHFVSREAMNIDGLSEQTLQFLINEEWVKNYIDLYELNYLPWIDKWKHTNGFGDKSVDKILNAIEVSKTTTLDKLLNAVSIPNIGKSTAKDIAKYCDYDLEKFKFYIQDCRVFENIDGIGYKVIESIQEWIDIEWNQFLELCSCLNIVKPNLENKPSADLSNKKFCITGSLNIFKNREEAKNAIENAGGKVIGSVTSKTDFLVNNDIDSKSGKNKKAKELNVPIINEEALILMLK